MEEGKLIGHIISKEGIRIDPSRVEAILKINPPKNKKEFESFIGRISFLRRFIPNLVDILRSITSMLKRDTKIKWNSETKKSFSKVKLTLKTTHLLISHDFTKRYIIFSFASDHTIVVFLLQNKKGQEQPITFLSMDLRDASLK